MPTATSRVPTRNGDQIQTLISAAFGYTDLTDLDFDQLVDELLSEPALSDDHLHALTVLVRRRGYRLATLAAICSHPLTSAYTIAISLWGGDGPTARAVSLATKTLLPAATWWVHDELSRGEAPGWLQNGPHPEQQRRITATAARWDAASAGNPTLRAFITASSVDFTSEEEMFAVGTALAAEPTA